MQNTGKNQEENQENKTYSDKEIQLATIMAYMEFTVDDKKYSSMKELMNTTRGREIEETFMKRYGGATDTITSDRRAAAQQMFEDIRNGVSPCSSWKVVDVRNNNSTTGMYACMIETSEGDAIVAFRGSEDLANNQLYLDWLKADVGLLDSTATEQQTDAEEYISYISGLSKQYDTYVFAGHSLGGNLAAHAGVTALKGILIMR